MQKLNHDIGVFICWITRKHREPHSILTIYPWRVEICNRCGLIFKKEKIGRTFAEIYRDEFFHSGNQIW